MFPTQPSPDELVKAVLDGKASTDRIRPFRDVPEVCSRCAPCFSPTDMAMIQSYTHSEINGPV
jgi:hypothetical protein